MIHVLVVAGKSIKNVVDSNHLEHKRKSISRTFGLCLLSSVCLTLAFPKYNYWILSWFALIPFMYCLDCKTPAGGFRTGFLFGLFFFTGIFYWFFHLTSWFSVIAAIGVIALLMYLSLYMAVFGWVYCCVREWAPLQRLFFLPSVWVCLEYVRGHLFSGFGWGYLGHSQYLNLPFIQIADVTGVYGISFIIFMNNLYFKEMRSNFALDRDRKLYKIIFYVCLCSVFLYGVFKVTSFRLPADGRVAVIQGNIPQEVKWSPHSWSIILERHIQLTEQAALERPDLIVWPETALPGFLGDDPIILQEIQELARRVQIPLLVGGVMRSQENQYFNTAVLLGPDGTLVERHSKIHLVPFGEYLPLRPWIPDSVEEMIPVDDFTAGEVHTLFKGSALKPFNALICFEDTLPYLVRQFAQKESHFFVNLTNDGWFKDSAAPFMHAYISLFRAVEHRRSLVRAANTGVSAFISPLGYIEYTVEDQYGKKTYVPGYVSAPV